MSDSGLDDQEGSEAGSVKPFGSHCNAMPAALELEKAWDLEGDSGSQFEGYKSAQYVPKNQQFAWKYRPREVLSMDLKGLGCRGTSDDYIVTDELRSELESDVLRALSYTSDHLDVMIFRDLTDPLLYRICLSPTKHQTLKFALVIVDVQAFHEYPRVAPALSSPNTPSRLLAEILKLLHPIDPSDISLNRFDQIILRAISILHRNYDLPSELGVKVDEVPCFIYYSMLVKIKHLYKDVYFNALDSTEDWRDFVLMHCSTYLDDIISSFDQVYKYSESISVDHSFFQEWVEADSFFRSKLSLEVIDDLLIVFENITFEPLAPMIEWGDPTELEPLPTELYEHALRQFRYNSFTLMDESGEFRHMLRNLLASQASMDHKAKRFLNEMKALSHGLPCTSPNSIFVVADSTRMDLLKALISGPADTPYAHGLFMFDVLCPEEYPHSPPKVKLATTGNGSVRFNPNLYNDGFVCLSIINTWDGDPEERWNSSRSNLLQVLVSIQALVMDNHVIQKEPGYEDYEVNYPGNVIYSNIVRYGTVKFAMLDLLTNTPPEFKEVILQHFSIKKKEILRTVKGWIDVAREQQTDYSQVDPLVKDHNSKLVKLISSQGYCKLLEEVAFSLKAQLDLLPDIASEDDLERLSLFAREAVCHYEYRPNCSGEGSEEGSGASVDEEEVKEMDTFYNTFSSKMNQDTVDLVNSPMPHAYAHFAEAQFDSAQSELELIETSFNLYLMHCVFVQHSPARRNLWRICCSQPLESCLSNGILLLDAFVSNEGLTALRMLNFIGMKLYSFIDHNGEVDLAKLDLKPEKGLHVHQVLKAVFSKIEEEEHDIEVETELLLTIMNIKFCMFNVIQSSWPGLDFGLELLKAKRDNIDVDMSRVFEIMQDCEDDTALKREIEVDNPTLLGELRGSGTLKEHFEEIYGRLTEILNEIS